ncbi:MAG TPA: tRNA (adenosine(37)-N6)-threonylcarbamoyltransferase complex ATPase subunit type 1 TsaE [Patescibacteria group bacterium]|nr:tRNA (adenosine(37)-N6)-threonylcarbamoyltransferase complex ATPase subunit type 1 TsaE [Patescibacteria group bacterium]
MNRALTTDLNFQAGLARQLALRLKGGEVLALSGPLGSGKTTFARQLARSLKIRHQVASPTFVLMNRYEGRLKTGRRIQLYHLDLYRTKSFREIRALGLPEIWGRPDTITVIEWADKIKRQLPKKTIHIKFASL